MDSLFRWVLGGMLLLGSPFLVLGGCEAMITAEQLRRSVRTQGTVIDNRLVLTHRDGFEEQAGRLPSTRTDCICGIQ